MRRFTLLTLLLIGCMFRCDMTGAVEASPLSVDQYLAQVTQSNEDYRATVLNRAGASDRSVEGSLLFSPQAFANVQYADDKRPTFLEAITGSENIAKAASFGVSQQFRFGLQAKLSYNVTYTSLLGANPAFVTQPRYFDNGLSLELSQPLWKNAFGRASRFTEDASTFQAKALSYGESFKGKAALADAESRYWRLAIAREIVKVQQQSLDRAINIRNFNAGRERLHLIDKADLLQSEAAVKARQLDLRSAVDEERAARRGFNSGRGLDSEEVSETLILPDTKAITGLEVPQRSALRDDVKAAELGLKAASAGNELSRDKMLPSLDVFASASTNGRDSAFSPSASESFGTSHPMVVAGLKFALPLDIGTTSTVRGAYLKELQGAELNYQRKLFDQENNWKDLLQKFTEAKARLAIAQELEEAQSTKLNEERKRQKEGRSTTFQVFVFEQEFLGSQLIRIQTQGLILGLLTQMKLYRGES